MVPSLRDLWDVVFDICYYAYQDFSSVLELEVGDIDYFHAKVTKKKKEELEALKNKEPK